MKRAGTWILIAAAVLLLAISARARLGGRRGTILPLRPVASQEYRVDLNACGEEELKMLPGVGEALAERIVKYREEKGGFESKEELLEIEGIGEGKYEAVQDYVTASPS